MYLSKDFIETAEGLVFAVVDQRLEQGRVLCFLRYVKDGMGWKKYPTEAANALLQKSFPQYLYFSSVSDVQLHAVTVDKIVRHHQPKYRLQSLLCKKSQDPVEHDLLALCSLLKNRGLDLKQVGVTGSLLIGAQTAASDIDLVLYGREHFFHCRNIIQQLINDSQLQNLSDKDWLMSYERRLCDLSVDEYIRHERRKFNKAVINGRKFDISLLAQESAWELIKYTKCGKTVLKAVVLDNSLAFDYPSILKIDHPQVSECVSFTATYAGQAIAGEKVEISGQLERSEKGDLRILVGSSREAEGEYIKVISWRNSAA